MVAIDSDPNIPFGKSTNCPRSSIPNGADETTMVCYGLKASVPQDPTFNAETEDLW